MSPDAHCGRLWSSVSEGAVGGDQKQSDDKELLRAWHEYGKNFSAFVPEEQPFPEIWEPEIPEPDDKGRVHMQALKHWQHLFPTRDFLRDRYAQFHILEGPSLRFDCLVPKFQKRMYYRVAEDQHGNPSAYSRQRHP